MPGSRNDQRPSEEVNAMDVPSETEVNRWGGWDLNVVLCLPVRNYVFGGLALG